MADLELDRARTALLSMDFHSAIVQRAVGGQEAAAAAKKALAAARQAGVLVIHVGLQRRPGLVSFRNKFNRSRLARAATPPASPQQPDPASDFVDDVAPLESEFIVHKPGISPFYGTDLEMILHVNDIHTLALMGVQTDVVVDSTARYAADADFRVIVLQDACASTSAEGHKASLAFMDRLADIATSADFVESLH